MAQADILKQLFDEKKIKVLQVFIQKPQEEFVLKEVVKKSKVPLATTHRILAELVDKELLKRSKQKHLKTYTLADNSEARFLSELLFEKAAPIAKFVDLIGSIPNIEQAIMHGKETESRANVVIIGTDIDRDSVNARVAQVREEDHFTINHLILDPEQFAMLEAMGQFSGTKTVLLSQ